MFNKDLEEINKSQLVMNNAKKQRKIIEWERLEISSRKLDTKGTFHAKMGSIKDRNGMDLTNRRIEMRWQEYTNYTKKIFTTQIITMV